MWEQQKLHCFFFFFWWVFLKPNNWSDLAGDEGGGDGGGVGRWPIGGW